ncbi:hypothetical protein IPL68_01655 [Candidatus Saccharibacteria bacterium]|nr:MAG: hypothetical protein IPL68_01655 [Candidatus Saccharibacteria bacterium]
MVVLFLGGTTTLNIGAGNGITVNADDIAIKTFAATDALSATASSGSGIEILASGVGLCRAAPTHRFLSGTKRPMSSLRRR